MIAGTICVGGTNSTGDGGVHCALRLSFRVWNINLWSADWIYYLRRNEDILPHSERGRERGEKRIFGQWSWLKTWAETCVSGTISPASWISDAHFFYVRNLLVQHQSKLLLYFRNLSQLCFITSLKKSLWSRTLNPDAIFLTFSSLLLFHSLISKTTPSYVKELTDAPSAV